MLDGLKHIETCIRCFVALARVKKSKEKKASWGENEIADLFPAPVGCEAEKKISTMNYQKDIEKSTHEEIAKNIKKNIRPKN